MFSPGLLHLSLSACSFVYVLPSCLFPSISVSLCYVVSVLDSVSPCVRFFFR